MAVSLGKDVTITGVSNARTVTVSNTANEVDITKFGDTTRKFIKAMVEQTVEIECVDAPGVSIGGTFTLSGTDTGDVVYVVTNVARSEPIDGIITYTVSAQRNASQS
jgi:predicted peroxiredoxin